MYHFSTYFNKPTPLEISSSVIAGILGGLMIGLLLKFIEPSFSIIATMFGATFSQVAIIFLQKHQSKTVDFIIRNLVFVAAYVLAWFFIFG